MWCRLGLREGDFALKVRDKSWNLSPPSNLRAEPTPSTTRRDTAMWRPWDSSTGRNVLWMSKIRWTEWLFCSSCVLCTRAHWVTTAQHTHLSLSMHSHKTPTHRNLLRSIPLILQNALIHTYTEIHTHHSGHLGRKPVTLAFYQLICCCYRNRSYWGRCAVSVCVLSVSALPRPHCDFLIFFFVQKIKSQKAFPHLFNQERAAGFPDCEWPVVWDQNTRLILTLGTWAAI